jgi:hypothetical protein
MSPVRSKAATCFEADVGWIKSNDRRCVALKSAALELGSPQDDKSTKLIALMKMFLR